MKKIILVGIDEAGRGPLAGPLCVAGVAIAAISKSQIPISNKILNFKFQNNKLLKGIRDSKKLSAKQREEWRKIIRENFEYATAFVGPQVIDRIGISKAAKLAVAKVLRRSVLRLRKQRTDLRRVVVLLDGSLFAPPKYEQQTIIRGDEKIPLISAASIIAKTGRDAKMLRFHEKFPQYCFDKHKGYGTELHYKMVKKHGLSFIHRRSFCRVV